MTLLKELRWSKSDDEAPVIGYRVLCPACQYCHTFRTVKTPGETVDIWEFDGNFDSPTFTPSMGANGNGNYPNAPYCHSYVTDGHWEFLKDSTHRLAGQTVAMIPTPKDAPLWPREDSQ